MQGEVGNAALALREAITITAARSRSRAPAKNGYQIDIFEITDHGGPMRRNNLRGSALQGHQGDSITAGPGNDTLVAAQNDTLLDGGNGNDTLSIGAALTNTSNAQIANIENVLLTAAVTLKLANQTEAFSITGSSGADAITGGIAADSINAGLGETLPSDHERPPPCSRQQRPACGLRLNGFGNPFVHNA